MYPNALWQANEPINFFLTESLNASERTVVRQQASLRRASEELETAERETMEMVDALGQETQRRQGLEEQLLVERMERAELQATMREHERVRRHLCQYIVELEQRLFRDPLYNRLSFKLRYGTVMNSRAFRLPMNGEEHYSSDGIVWQTAVELHESDTTLGSEDEDFNDLD